MTRRGGDTGWGGGVTLDGVGREDDGEGRGW